MWDPRTYEDTDYGLRPGESFEPADAWDVDTDVTLDGPHVMSVLGPIHPDALGVTLHHVHLMCDPVAVTENKPEYRLDSAERIEEDVEAFITMNGRSLVDCSTRDYGRNTDGLIELAGWLPIHLIAVTGRHKHLHASRLSNPLDVDALAAEFVRDLSAGMDGTDARAGVIKIGTSEDDATDVERAAISAAGIARQRTGAPVTTHTEQGTYALEQLALLEDAGVDPRRVIVGHLDRKPEFDYLREIASSGAFISFDQIGKNESVTDGDRAAMLVRLLEHGFGDQLLLSLDYGRTSLLRGYGGEPGLAYLQEWFMVQLMQAGADAQSVRQMVVENPARALTIHPPSAQLRNQATT